MALVTEKQRTRKDQEAFERLLDSLSKSTDDANKCTTDKQRKQKVLGVKGLHHKRNKGRRR